MAGKTTGVPVAVEYRLKYSPQTCQHHGPRSETARSLL